MATRTPEDLGEELVTRLRDGAVAYDLRAQLFVDESRTPIEDPTVDWSDADAPFMTIARLTLPKQDARSPRGEKVARFIEELSLDPWHAKVEHRPLGAIMRARNHAYRLRAQERKAAREPDGSERFE